MAHQLPPSPPATQSPRAPEIDSYLRAVREGRGPNAYVALLGLHAYETPALQKKIEHGLAYAALNRILRLMALPGQTLADLLFIPPRTLQRRKASGRLEPDESDRLLRLARVYGKAIELFEGDNPAALQWLHAPLTALGGASPLAMSRTEPGSQEVERLITRLEHGVIS
jgi:putative toxin-antitoxin system antitoxin component (TIGR02293 family)